MESEPLMPSNDVAQKESFRTRSRSWFIPASLLILFLVTAAAFFLATAPKKKLDRVVAIDLPQPPRGGVLRFPLLDNAPISTLDPARAEWGAEIMLIQQIYDGLTALDEQLNVVPALAQYWEISHDGKTYTFELRPDAVFHNGRPVTAEDCVYSFQRLLTAGFNTNNYHYFSRIEGAREFREGLAGSVSGLRALDEQTFQIRFTSPFVPALSVMSMYCSKILPKKELLEEGDDFFQAPVGTGPFRFSHWIGRDEDPAVPIYRGIPQALRLEANRNYFGQVPYLDATVIRSMWNARGVEGKPLGEMFDFLLAESYYEWLPVETEQLLALYYLILPIKVPPYDDARVRRAVSYALNKRSFLDSNPFTAGAPAASGIVPPGIPGFLRVESMYEHHLEKAKELLAEAGYPSGKGLPPLELPVYRYDEPAVARRQCLIGCLASVGLKIVETPVKRMPSPGDPEFEGRPILYEQGWIADFPDPDNFLRPLFYSTSPINQSGYSNPDVDRLLDRAWTETSYSTRNKIYGKVEKILLKDSPIIPLHYGKSRYVIRPNVKGLSISPMGITYIKLNRVWISKKEEAAETDL